MAKNISVIDSRGNEYEATYPKRAKGLVKKGRARFVDEMTICLACPPYHTEDNMEENRDALTALESGTMRLNAAYVIEKIDQIMEDSRNLQKALEMLESEHVEIDCMGNTAMAIGNMIQARECTNQAMIDLLVQIVEKL